MHIYSVLKSPSFIIIIELYLLKLPLIQWYMHVSVFLNHASGMALIAYRATHPALGQQLGYTYNIY